MTIHAVFLWAYVCNSLESTLKSGIARSCNHCQVINADEATCKKAKF